MTDSGKERNEEGISLISGIEPLQVRDILHEGPDGNFEESVQSSNPFARILAAWHTDHRFTGPYGVLRDLPFSQKEADALDAQGPTFCQLAKAICPEIAPEVLLEELLRNGCVQSLGGGFYRAVERSYIPDPLSTSSVMMVARGVHNLCETFERNLRTESAGGKGLIERTIYTRHKVSERDQKLFDAFIRSKGQMFANDVDNWLNDYDKPGSIDGARIGVEFHHYIVNEEDEADLSKEIPK
jgi:hypothetical protein